MYARKLIPRINIVQNPMRAFSTTSPSIIATKNKNLVVLELNRAKALNSLTLDMCHDVKDILQQQINAKNSGVGAFLVKGSGEKAYCAGGDVKAMWNELQSLDRANNKELGIAKPGFLHTDFFRVEYTMNYLLGTSSVPQISLWNGIVMGGGVGLSVLGEYRVATEKSLFAMPECTIGLFPDVGSSAWLPHLQDGYGLFIGLTGARLNAADLVHTGIATHFVDSSKLAELEKNLTDGMPDNTVDSRKFVKTTLDTIQSLSENRPNTETSTLAINAEVIKKCFGEDVESVEKVVSLLEEEKAAGNEWAGKQLEILNKSSPTSLKLTFEQLRRGKTLDLAEGLKMEFRIVNRCISHNDFSEGVRALLVEKDNAPKWSPATIADVSNEYIATYFEPLGEHELKL